jgi:predicted permease
VLGAPWLFAFGALVKFAPALGIVYLAARGRWRDALAATGLGALIVAVSVVLAPQAWLDYADILASRGPADEAGFLPIPFVVRLGVGVAVAVVAGRLRPRLGGPLLVVAVVVASPTLWATAFALLVAVVPVVRDGRPLRWKDRDGRQQPSTPRGA